MYQVVDNSLVAAGERETCQCVEISFGNSPTDGVRSKGSEGLDLTEWVRNDDLGYPGRSSPRR